MKDLRDYSLLAHNMFGIDAHCTRFLEYETTVEAQQVARILRETSLPYIIIGGGSNLLLTGDYEGIVVHSAIKGWDIAGRRMACGSGETWDDMVAVSLQNKLYGAENLSLIPGDVGASAVQNIGAYGVEAKDFIREVHAVEIATGRLCIIDHNDCQYGYRQSRFKREWKNRFLITMVVFEFSDTFQPRLDYGNIRAELARQDISSPTAQQLRQVIIDIRNAKLPDPKVLGNAGSFFMNPVVDRTKYEELAAQYPQMPHYTIDAEHEKIPAGWMIDQCGWKGRSLGRAGVHDKQALVLVNRGGATGEEIVALCHRIQADVKQRFGIDIYPEVNVI
jgi:UDP-N-acetylmuramate dehydrogenase